jgi:hypothetical protein
MMKPALIQGHTHKDGRALTQCHTHKDETITNTRSHAQGWASTNTTSHAKRWASTNMLCGRDNKSQQNNWVPWIRKDRPEHGCWYDYDYYWSKMFVRKYNPNWQGSLADFGMMDQETSKSPQYSWVCSWMIHSRAFRVCVYSATVWSRTVTRMGYNVWSMILWSWIVKEVCLGMYRPVAVAEALKMMRPKTGSGAHPVSHIIGTGNPFQDTAAEAIAKASPPSSAEF